MAARNGRHREARNCERRPMRASHPNNTSIVDDSRSACLCNEGLPGIRAVVAVDENGRLDYVLMDQSLGNEGRFDPSVTHAAHEQLGPLPKKLLDAIAGVEAIDDRDDLDAQHFYFPHRCGRPTKTTGRPCRIEVACPDEPCGLHRETGQGGIVTNNFETLIAALAGAPALHGARCRGKSQLFDDAAPREAPQVVAQRHDQALRLCAACGALDPCRDWVQSLAPSRRPSGVVAGQVWENGRHKSGRGPGRPRKVAAS